jgi:ribonucleoside-diphosphate reductase alpha chain
MSEDLKFTFEEVQKSATDWFDGDTLAGDVFAKKYALQDLEGNFYEIDPQDAWRRCAKELARIERNYPNPMSEEEIFQMMSRQEFVLQGSPYSGIGNPFQIQSISNCFVIDAPQDSYGGIFLADQEQVQIMKRRGGVGHDISPIRPKGLPAKNAARTTDGIGVFMERFSNSTREVAQGGRRGALMISISVHHPEIMTFINIKKDKTKVTGANISIRVSDEFMQAVRDGREYQQRFPVEKDVPHLVERMVPAKEIWDAMMEAAWESAEPGILFWDTILRLSPADCYADLGYRTESTNPCGELPLCPYDSCRLALLCLTKFVVNPFTPQAYFDYDRFSEAAEKAQRLMDDIVDLELEMIDRIIAKVESDPEPEHVKRVELDLWQKIKKTTANGRRTGLGVTGLGDCLAMLDLKYGTDESIEVVSHIYRQLAISSYRSSVDMAWERGAFPIYDYAREVGHPFIERIMSHDAELRSRYEARGRRNIANLTTAPVGSLSTQTQTTNGIEPAIFIEGKRRRKINPDDRDARVDFVDQNGDTWQEYKIYHHGVTKWMSVTGETDVTKSPYWGATAEEIDWVKKVELQAAAQEWIDHSISNTTNLPKDVTVETVSQIYMRGWETGCKGVTVYRDGSRSGVLVKSDDTGDHDREGNTIRETMAPRRPEQLPCHIHRASVKGEQYLILIGLLDGQPYEIFAGLADHVDIGKKEKEGVIRKERLKSGNRYDLQAGGELFVDIVGQFDNPNHGAFTRTLSTALRHGVPVRYLVEQLRKDKGADMFSFSSVIARVLAKSYIPDGTKTTEKKCAECSGTNLGFQQGCVTCLDCGYSKCG